MKLKQSFGVVCGFISLYLLEMMPHAEHPAACAVGSMLGMIFGVALILKGALDEELKP